MSDQVKRINKILEVTQGRNPKGEALFRIVFSDDQREKRFGVFNEFYGSIFIREVRGLQDVPKYAYLKHVWVLERWLPPEQCYTDEIPATREGSYEPLFAFINDKYEAIPIILDEVLRIIHTALNPVLPGHKMSDLKAQEQIELDQEVQRNLEEITEAGRTWVGHRLHSGEGIIKP